LTFSEERTKIIQQMDLLKPKMPDLKSDILIMVKERFLKHNDLDIGDNVIWNFRYDTLRSQYKGGMACYGANEESEGVLKVNEDGFLFVESLKDYSFYTDKWNGRTGRQSRHNWERTMKKATHFFGTGFIAKPKST